MNTTTAATQAGVTIPTIRTWCRTGVITAVKQAGKWVIDQLSLAARIAIGLMRTRKAHTVPQPPIHLTSKTRHIHGHIGAVGPADTLKAAFETGQPITLDGKFAGERVYLGHTRQIYDDGITLETIGLDHELGESPKFPGVQGAVYLIDLTRLDEAPRLAEIVREAEAKRFAAVVKAERRAAEEEDRYLNQQEY